MDFGDFGRRCMRYKRTKAGMRCAEFSGADDMMGMDDMGDFGDFGEGMRAPGVAGPLIGGGLAQVGTMATKMLWPDKPIAKWAGLVGTMLGGAVSGFLAFRPNTRQVGISGLVTAALIGIPRQIEDMLGPKPGAASGYLGVVTAERELADALGADDSMWGQSPPPVELLDSGAGSTGMIGVVTAEEEMSGAEDQMGAQPPVELLGGGFGSNFLG